MTYPGSVFKPVLQLFMYDRQLILSGNYNCNYVVCGAMLLATNLSLMLSLWSRINRKKLYPDKGWVIVTIITLMAF